MCSLVFDATLFPAFRSETPRSYERLRAVVLALLFGREPVDEARALRHLETDKDEGGDGSSGRRSWRENLFESRSSIHRHFIAEADLLMLWKTTIDSLAEVRAEMASAPEQVFEDAM